MNDFEMPDLISSKVNACTVWVERFKAYCSDLAAHVKTEDKYLVLFIGSLELLLRDCGKWLEGGLCNLKRCYPALMNKHRVCPVPTDRLGRYPSVEGGCYW